MRNYELVVIFPLEEDQHKAGRDQLLADLAANGATVEKTEEMGDRDFAYEINKRQRGKYVLLIVNASPEKITNLDRIFKLNANLLRYQFVRVEG